MFFVLVAAILGAAFLLRARVRRGIERDSLARRPVGPDGIVIGGEPIALDGTGPGAILLLHGFGDTPQSVAFLASKLHQRGWTVRVPLLPGHGRTIREFANSRASQWIEGARTALADLRSQHSNVAIGGLSMGGALAAILAADDPTLVAVVLMAPYVEMPVALRLAVRAHTLIDAIFPYLYWIGETRSIRDPVARAQSLCSTGITAGVVAQLEIIARRALAALPRISVPTLIVQSPDDNRIRPAVARRALDRLGTQDRHLTWVSGTHVITVDVGADAVARTVGEFFDTRMMQYHTHSVALAAHGMGGR